MQQLREAEGRAAEQSRQRERTERETADLKESSKKYRQALDEGEKVTRELRWELEDRRQISTAEASKQAVYSHGAYSDVSIDWCILN